MLIRYLHPITSILLAVAAGAPALAEEGSDYTVRLIGGAWFAAMGGDFDYDTDDIEGTTFDTDEFDLDSATLSPQLEVGIALPVLFDIHAGMTSYGAEGDARLDELNAFNGVPIQGDTTVDFTMTDLYGEIAWRPVSLDLVAASVGLAVHSVDIDVDSDLGQEELDETIPIPALSGRVWVNPWAGWTIEGKLHVMAIDIGDVDASYSDFHALVSYRWVEWVGVTAGYRFLAYDIQSDLGDEDISLKLNFHGPFLGLVAQF